MKKFVGGEGSAMTHFRVHVGLRARRRLRQLKNTTMGQRPSRHAAFRVSNLLCATLLCAACMLLASDAALAFEGRVLDAYTERPLAGVLVRDLASDERVVSDESGRFVLADRGEARSIELTHREEGENSVLRYGPLSEGRPHTLRIFAAGGPAGEPLSADAERWGVPGPRGPELPDEPLLLQRRALSDSAVLLPESIRVAMHEESDCAMPIAEIVEVPIEDYVEGAVYSEIGVFGSMDGGPASARAVFEAFAIAVRSYALYFYYRDPGAAYHINNTACNQRYEPVQSNPVRQAVAATAGMVFVDADDPHSLGKYEYAASCGRHGSRPEHQSALIPDVTGVEACVGSWCGHNSCAAHEVNPAVPDEGRCLVRGVCQWGAAERSLRGDSWQDIVAHYQPNLRVVQLSDAPPTRLRGFVREGDVYFGAAIPQARVTLGGIGVQVTGDSGAYAFDDIDAGTYLFEVAAPGYQTLERVIELEAGQTTWRSFALRLDEGAGDAEGEPDVETPADVGADADAGSVSDVRENAEVDTGSGAAQTRVATGCSSTPLVGGVRWWSPLLWSVFVFGLLYRIRRRQRCCDNLSHSR